MRKAIALSFTALSLLACGGGGSGSDSLPGGSGGGNLGSSFVAVKSVSADRTSISERESIQISWEVSFSSVNGLYTAEVYISSTQDVPSPAYNYRLYTANCGNGSVYTCGTTGQVRCTYTAKFNGVPAFICNTISKSIPFTGNGYLVFRACIWDSNLRYVCNKKALPLRVN